MSHVDIRFADKNSERYMLARRIYKVIEDLENEYLYPDSETLGGFKFRDGQYKFSQIDEGEWTDFDSENDYWGYKEDYAWFRHSFVVPERFAGRPVVYQLTPSASGPWNRSNPQFIMYFNGELRQGGDSNHSEIRLLDCAKGGEEFDCCFNAYSDAWEFKGKLRMGARLKVVDDLVNRLIFDLRTPLKVASLYNADDLPRIDIVKALNDAVNLIDFNTSDYDTFAASAEAAIDLLDREIYSKDAMDATACCIGHTHIDVAWLWRLRQTREKAGRSFATVLKLMEEYPEYKFMSSQAQLYAFVKEDYPEVYEGIKKMIAAGRWEVEGSMWVESDTNVTSGESLVRQFLVGKRFFKDEFGVDNKIMWLPDVFGYSAALPQIMKKAGINYFMTTKISWNEFNKVPYDTFMWKGIDGSTVTVHFNTIHTWVDDKAVQKRLDDVADKSESRCLLMAYGFGDGGGGPSEEMVKRAIHTQYNCKKAEVRHTTVSDFMKKLSEQQLPTYFGELYLELHRGTYTTNHSLKQCNRRLEEALHDAEAVSVFADDKQAKNLTDGWYDVLMLNQFHDILPGTAIAQASAVALAQLKKALKEAKEYMSGKGAKHYFNTLPFKRREVLPSATGQSYIDLFGKKRTVASYQFAPYGYGKKVADKGGFCFDGENVTTPQLTAKLKNGVLVSLVYKDREYVKNGFNVVRCAEDVPYIYDNWDIDADYVLKEKDAQFLRQDVVSVGATLLVVRAVYRLTEKSLLYTDIKFRADTPLVEFENRLCFYDTHTVVRTYFDTTLFAQRYRCETQFGFVERNCFPQDKSDIAKFEVCSHKWTDLSEKNCGLSLLSDSKYGVSCNGGKMGLTLHKSGTHPDSRGDVGESTFRYALLPHTGDLTMETVCHAYCFSHLPISTARQNLHLPFEVVSDGSVVTETIKFGEKQGTVLRLYECLGGSASATVRAAGKQIVSCNIMEDTLAVLGEDCAQLQFSPFEIKTVILK